MLGSLCARMHAKKRPNGWLISRGIKGSQCILRRITGPDGNPFASLGCKYCRTRSCWLCKDIIRLFRRLGLGCRAASISHPYLMQTFRYTKNNTCHLRWTFLSSGICMNACNGRTYQEQHSSMWHVMQAQRQCSAHKTSQTFRGKRCSHRNQYSCLWEVQR